MHMKFWLLMIILVPFDLFAQSNLRENRDNQMSMNALIENGAVTRVLIFHVSDSISTRVPVTPQALLSMAGSSYEITTDIKKRLDPVFAGVKFQKRNRVPDLRWGLLFYGADNHEIGEIFIDQFGHSGYVNKVAGEFQSDHPNSNLVKELHRLTGNPH